MTATAVPKSSTERATPICDAARAIVGDGGEE
jgi:hypothetical protein